MCVAFTPKKSAKLCNGVGVEAHVSVLSFLRRLIEYRWPVAVLFRRDFVAPLQGSVFGVAWNVILPLVPIGAYVLLRVFIAPGSGEEAIVPVVFVTIGVTFWFLLVDVTTQTMNAAQRHRSIILNSDFPFSGLLIASWARIFFEFGVRLCAVVIVLWLYLEDLPVGALLVFPVIVVAFLFAAALGIGLLLVQFAFPDIQQIMQIVLRYLIFLSGVIFPLANVPYGQWLYICNPFAVFIENARSLLVFGTPASTPQLVGFAVASLLLFCLATVLVQRTERTIRGLV